MGLYFIFTGVTHFNPPPNLPAVMQWMYSLPAWLHYLSGGAEILGGIGLILPGLAKIQTRLTPLAAAGLVLVMLGAMVYHILRGESQNLLMNLVLAVILGFIAYRRWRANPLPERSE
jgi:uncharacterized membrane protein